MFDEMEEMDGSFDMMNGRLEAPEAATRHHKRLGYVDTNDSSEVDRMEDEMARERADREVVSRVDRPRSAYRTRGNAAGSDGTEESRKRARPKSAARRTTRMTNNGGELDANVEEAQEIVVVKQPPTSSLSHQRRKRPGTAVGPRVGSSYSSSSTSSRGASIISRELERVEEELRHLDSKGHGQLRRRRPGTAIGPRSEVDAFKNTKEEPLKESRPVSVGFQAKPRINRNRVLKERKQPGQFLVHGSMGKTLGPLIDGLLDRDWKQVVSTKQKFTYADLQNVDLLLTLDNLEGFDVLYKATHVFHNHFEKNEEITTKCGLAMNIQDLIWTSGVNADTIFPRCYSLGSSSDIAAFVNDFRYTAAGGILRVFVKFGDACLLIVDEHVIRLALTVCERRLLELSGQVHRGRYLRDTEWEQILEGGRRLSKKLETLENCGYGSSVSSSSVCGALRARAFNVAHSLAKRDPQWILNGNCNTWIVKPADKSKGAGIFLSNSLDKLVADAQRMGGGRIIQKYVENPLLGPGKRKLDIRVWALVTSWDPLVAYVYHPFYCRICKDPYSLSTESLGKSSIHLCNFSIQHHSEYLTEEALFEFMETDGRLKSHEEKESLLERIDSVCLSALRAGQNKVVHRDRTFELYGIDLILDEQLNVWLLEANLSPGLTKHDDQFADIVQDMNASMLDIVFSSKQNQNNKWKSLAIVPARTRGNSMESLEGDNEDIAEDDRGKEKARRPFPRGKVAKKHRACGIKFLLQGSKLNREQVRKIDSRFKYIRATELIANFASNLSELWQTVKIRRSNARLVIQCAARRFLAMREQQRRFDAYRKDLVTKMILVQLRRRQNVSKLIQHSWRRHMERVEKDCRRETFQKWMRVTTSMKKAKETISRAVHTYHFRKMMQRKVQERATALHLQSWFRHILAKLELRKLQHAQHLRREKMLQLRQLTIKRVHAAHVIRQAWRRHLYCRYIYALKIQTCWKRYVLRQTAATFIQTTWRMHDSKMKLRLRKSLRKWVKSHMLQKLVQKRRKEIAAVKIQVAFRLSRTVSFSHKRGTTKPNSTTSGSTFLTAVMPEEPKPERTKKQRPVTARTRYNKPVQMEPKKRKNKTKNKLCANIHERLVPTHKTEIELQMSQALRMHRMARPKLPPPLFDL